MSAWIQIGVAVALAMGGLGSWIAVQKDRSPAEGFVLGLLFGPLGVIVEAMMPSSPPSRRDEGRSIVHEDDEAPPVMEALVVPKERPREVPKALNDLEL